MERRNFIRGSAILGMSAASTPLILAESGMFHSKTRRSVYRILDSRGVIVGTLPVMRAFAGNHLDYVSPFVLFDEFGPVDIYPGQDPLKVEAHPHAGVSPTTYFVEGSGHHKDSLNYDFQISKGDFMMFNSGKGAIHMEESGDLLAKNGGIIHGFQIWLNIPQKYKFINPSTTVNDSHDMATIKTDSYSINVVLGELFGKKSNIELLTPAFYYHVKMEANSKIDIPTNPLHNAFVYQIKGEIELESARQLKENQLALYQRGESLIRLYAKEKSEYLVLGGEPLNEVVYSYGPFVMNTKEQINQCIRNYRSGKMGDPTLVNK